MQLIVLVRSCEPTANIFRLESKGIDEERRQKRGFLVIWFSNVAT